MTHAVAMQNDVGTGGNFGAGLQRKERFKPVPINCIIDHLFFVGATIAKALDVIKEGKLVNFAAAGLFWEEGNYKCARPNIQYTDKILLSLILPILNNIGLVGH